jgi:alpha-1,3-rhamnosyltransferase
MENSYNPLVSIVVITYNSSRFVLDTLESAKVQTYQNIELVVSDDCSTDNTVEICKKWIEENKDRFVRTELITVDKNTGIPANCNRGWRTANGEWIKLIAGDDALFSYAIEKVMDYLSLHPEISVIDTAAISYRNTFEECNIAGRIQPPEWFFTERINVKKQHKLILIHGVLNGTTFFFQRKLLADIDGFDERFKMLEDRPIWCKITKYGRRIYFHNLNTVKYRLHDSSVFSTVKDNKIFNNFYKQMFVFTKTVAFPEINFILKSFFYMDYYVRLFYDKNNLNNKNKKMAYLIFKIWIRISPIRLFIEAKKKYYQLLA